MCTPSGAVATIATSLFSIGSQAVGYAQNKKIQEYQTQIALNNIQSQKNEAKAALQTGIEEAREKKTNALKNQSNLIAKNAASGFDVNSQTNLYNSQDLIDEADNSARQIKENARDKAYNILKSADNSALSLKAGTLSYNSNLAGSLIGLGSSKAVSNVWNIWNGKNEDELL